ncbi:reverse transcriptase [Gossypium australe]|uniref:Reverse transcriptase n=1 Tax=Gossypium australe TaxID=47621 RepID=A0A5B6WT16_9ROSI|nr:reverse transcriptase [Gossypium australe]
MWKSIWATKDLLKKGLLWRVGIGENISISSDAWIPSVVNFRLSTEVDFMRDLKGQEVIEGTFLEEDSARILRIPLAEIPHAKFLVWGGEGSGEFSIRSAYKLLQTMENHPRAYALQSDYKKFYKKLWLLNLLIKMKITIWRITWNYLPTKANMQHRGLVNDASCPWCGEGTEMIDHLFRECPVTVEVWSELLLQELCTLGNMGGKNARIHKKQISTSKDIRNFVNNYITEIDGLESRKQIEIKEEKVWRCPPRGSIKINFDGAFDERINISVSGIVARNDEGSILFSCSEIDKKVNSAFAAEALACRKAVKMGIENMWPDFIIEGDALTVIKK